MSSGSRRGLDTRVSLKQALAAQGFQGGSRGATEWTQWVQAEKEVLAKVMERYGFEWEQKGTHEQHLSVLEYKKQERAKELAAVEEKLTESRAVLEETRESLRNYQKAEVELKDLEKKIDTDPGLQLPEPTGLMSAKTYRSRLGLPVMEKLKQIIKSLLLQYFRATEDYLRVNRYNGTLYRENQDLALENEQLREENGILRKQNKEYSLLRKVFGRDQIESWAQQAKEKQKDTKRQTER